MKKIIVIILSILSLNTFSQDKSFQIALKSGAGISSIYSKDADFDKLVKPKNLSNSFINGLSLIYQPVNFFTIQTDILLTSRAFVRDDKFKDENNNYVDYKIKTGYHYLSFSLLPGFKTKGKTSFFFNSGVSFSYLFDRKHKAIYENENPDYEITFLPNPTEEKRFDLGIIVETGLQQQITKFLDFKFGVRNETSIINNVKNYRYNPIKFNTTNVFVGLTFKFGKTITNKEA